MGLIQVGLLSAKQSFLAKVSLQAKLKDFWDFDRLFLFLNTCTPIVSKRKKDFKFLEVTSITRRTRDEDLDPTFSTFDEIFDDAFRGWNRLFFGEFSSFVAPLFVFFFYSLTAKAPNRFTLPSPLFKELSQPLLTTVHLSLLRAKLPDVSNCKCTILSSSIKDYRSHRDVNNKQILEK